MIGIGINLWAKGGTSTPAIITGGAEEIILEVA